MTALLQLLLVHALLFSVLGLGMQAVRTLCRLLGGASAQDRDGRRHRRP